MLRCLLESVAAALGLLVCSPLLLCIAICIVANDGGSVFYRQERLGRGGRTFSLIKFRTMIASAESGIPQLAVEADRRVTRCGRFLRRHTERRACVCHSFARPFHDNDARTDS